MTRMKRVGLAVALLALPCLNARAQTGTETGTGTGARTGTQAGSRTGQMPESMLPAIAQVLSLITGGMLPAGTAPPQVVADGDAFDVRIPVTGLTTPADAAMQAVLRPAGGGIWDLVSLTLPAPGSVMLLPGAKTTPRGRQGNAPPGTLTFSIREQAIHGRIDPTLTSPSPYAGVLSGIEVRADLDGMQIRQTLDRYSTNGVLTGEPDNRMTLRSQAALLNWHMNVENRAGVTGVGIKSMAVNYAVEGLDRDKATQLRALLGQFSGPSQSTTGSVEPGAAGPGSAGPGAAGPGSVGPGSVGPGAAGPSAAGPPAFGALALAKRAPLTALLGIGPGLLSRISDQVALQDIHFDQAGGGGEIGQLRLSIDGAAVGDRVNGSWDLALSGLKLSAAADSYGRYVPSRIKLRLAASGVRSAMLRQLIRDYTGAQPDAAAPDVAAIRQDAAALLADPGTRIGIEAFSIDTDPLHVEGFSHIRASTDGTMAVDIHVAATGVDAMIAQVQGDPSAQQVLPMVFLAKGMGRADGDTLVWDISFAGGVTTVNGMPLGGQAAHPQAGQPPRP